MGPSLGLRMSRHHEPDFEQRYADLNEGYENYAKYVEERTSEIASSQEYTTEQKQELLNIYKEDLLQKQQEYYTEYQSIAAEEAQYRAEQYGDYGAGTYADYSCDGEAAESESFNQYTVEEEFAAAETAVEEASNENSMGNEM